MLQRRRIAACAAITLVMASAQAAEPPSAEEMWRIIQEQQKQIQELREKLAATDEKVEETDEKVEIAAESMEQATASVSRADAWASRTTLGGYGEMHYNNLDSKEEVDFHRYVMFVGHKFTEDIRFFSEVELEHSIAGDDQNGEVELEQAFVEFDVGESTVLKGGLFLMPVGILNETHEPATFYGVERNPVEKNIIPTTWWEGGGEVRGQLPAGFSYNLALTSGLSVDQTGSKAFLIRNGRQKVSEAAADDLAYTGRIKWTGMPGVELGLTGQYQNDVTQGDLDIDATLVEAHADIRRGPLGLRALYARWDLDDSSAIDASDPAAVGRDEQFGWYLEPSLRGSLGSIMGEFGAFVRYSVWDNNAGRSNDTEMTQYNAGINYWPIPDVVLKLDVQQQDNDGAEDDDGWNLGIGYQF